MSLLAAQAFSTCICIDKYKKAKPTPWRSGRLAVTVFFVVFFELADSEYRRSARYQRLFFLMFTFLLFSVSYFFLF